MTAPRVHATVLALLLVSACGDHPTPSDAPDGSPTTDVIADVTAHDAQLDGDAPINVDAPSHCADDTACDDGVFCDGVERCTPGDPHADSRGCVAGTAPCPSGQTCTESARTCSGGCPDADGDGHTSSACGGDDCDDADPHRFPGNTEVCAVAMVAGDGGATALTRTDPAMGLDPSHDEDCDPTTFSNAATHDGDHDGDGFVDSACANVDSSGARHGGDDCDDLDAVAGVPASFMTSARPQDVHPSQPEVCNGIDDNCSGTADEGLALSAWHRDCDGDGAGESAAMMGCAAEEFRCNGRVAVRDGTDCDDANAAVHPGATEVCNGVDDNCNGGIDEGAPMRTWYPDADGDGYGVTTSPMMACTQPAGYAAASGDCCDTDPAVHPSVTAFHTSAGACGGFDYNCDGSQELEYSVLGATPARCTSAAMCGMASGWVATVTVPCGRTASFIDCRSDGGSGCTSAGTTRTQGCR